MKSSSQWRYSTEHKQLCQILETISIWDETVHRVWLPEQDAVVRVRADSLRQFDEYNPESSAMITYVASAGRIADALAQDVLLSPIESTVIPLPHQIKALSRAISGDRIRYLLADEVGLGKTIEAGLIMRELKLRGLVNRVLIVVPKGLTNQWLAEMKTHFGEDFSLIIPSDLSAYRHIMGDSNIWRSFDQVICPMDSVKPMESRRGWSREKIAEYNSERFEDLITAGWDLVIVDEAHRLGGSTDQVARYKLSQGLAESAPYILLLSATPHQGKTDSFHRIISLLDPLAFPDIGSVTRERVMPYVIRTEKRHAIDAEGNPLFLPRQTRLIPVEWEERHYHQKQLYDMVTDYVREGYNQAIIQKQNYIGFLMILMQRLVTSSTRAIRDALERRLDVLESSEEQLTNEPIQIEEDWEDLDAQEQLETLLHIKALRNEKTEVKSLIDMAINCEQSSPDVKAEALLEWIYKLQQEEREPDLKILIFTEFVSTQDMLRKFLQDRGFTVACLNGSMGLGERTQAQETFAGSARVMISTDAGGEGLNLQFCHVVINYDIPWNPMKLEQRIGRVDRIGQKHIVQAINFIFEDTVEHRVREVLEEKLAIILTELGIDKTGDVLDSAQAGNVFDRLYIDAIMNPESIESEVDSIVNQIRKQAESAKESLSMLGTNDRLDPDDARRFMTHPIPHWVERMTVSYIEAYGGKSERKNKYWELTLPDGETLSKVTFTSEDVGNDPTIHHLTLEDSRIRGLVSRLPRFVPEQPIPEIYIPSLPKDVSGIWSLWRISIYTEDWNRQRIMPLFVHDDGRVLIPTARYIWDQMLIISPEICGYMLDSESGDIYHKCFVHAESQGRLFYDELLQEHRNRLDRERQKGEYSFSARRHVMQRVGLPEVRNYRLNRLAEEEKEWRKNLEKNSVVLPELTSIIFIWVMGAK